EAHPVASTAELVEQRVVFVDKADKRALLSRVLKDGEVGRALVFTRTKHGADRVVRQLAQDGVPADAIHGNKSQNARTGALERFRTGAGRVLVATDIAARGIDVEGITHVINYDLPNIPESYVHRIGRTARAGRSGVALSFCDAEERAYLRDIEALIRARIQVVADHPLHPGASASPSPASRATPPPTTSRPSRARSRRRTRAARAAGGGHPAVRENREHAGLRPR
ncbi:MAG TPA: C-terminal helicase domain-containing protein, partial [Albitalea sp.]